MLSGSAIGTVSVWEVSTGNFIKQNRTHRDEVTQILVFLNGTRVLSCDKSGVVHIWNLMLGDEPIQMDLLSVLNDVQAPIFLRINDIVLIGQIASNARE